MKKLLKFIENKIIMKKLYKFYSTISKMSTEELNLLKKLENQKFGLN